MAPPPTVKLGNYNRWCYSITVMTTVIPVLILLRYQHFTPLIFLGYLLAVVLVILVCFLQAIFQTRARQLFQVSRRSRAIQHRRWSTHIHGPVGAASPVDRNILVSTHRIMTPGQRFRSAFRVDRPPEVETPDSQSAVQGQGTPPTAVPPIVYLAQHETQNDYVQFFNYHVQLPMLDESPISPSESQLDGVVTSSASMQMGSPPPYHVAINLPAPDRRWSSREETCETPPPPYEQTLKW